MVRIAFLLGSADISGGTNVILEYGIRMQNQGDEVFLVTLDPVDSTQLFWHKGAASLSWITLEDAQNLSFDILLATWWQSVFLLEKVQAQSYCYFVQSIESRFFPPQNSRELQNRDIDVLRDWCESSYFFPLPVITEARWICDYLHDLYGHKPVLVRNGIRKDIYNTNGKCVAAKNVGKLRVLVEGPLNVFFKNVEKTIELCLKSDADEVWLLTSSQIQEYAGVDKCFSKVPIEKTAEIYRSCDVLVKLSYVEGMFGPPLEMFHCGGTAIVYDVTGHDEYIKHEQNALVVNKDAEADVVSWINRLKCDPEFLAALCHEAFLTAKHWPDWQIQAEQFSKQLKKITASSQFTQKLVAGYTARSSETRDRYFKSLEYARFFDRENALEKSSQYQNFIQVYYHHGRGYTNEVMLWDDYLDNGWQTCSVVLPFHKRPMAIRLDPSVRIGVISIRSVRIVDKDTGGILGEWNSHTGFKSLLLHGTCRQIENKKLLKIFAYGEDPQIQLPGTYLISGRQVELQVELFEERVWNTLQALSGNPVKRWLKKIVNFLRAAQ
jgi:glycosyltransferase involved in cell wall biosynthesis